MYGENRLNAHSILRYGFTIEFIRHFRFIRYKNIELPTTMIRPFHVWIRPKVETGLARKSLVEGMQNKLGIKTMADVQQALFRVPEVEQNLAVYPHRNTIILPASMGQFAVEHLADHAVILLYRSPRELQVLQELNLPKRFTVYDFKKSVSQAKVSTQTRTKYKQQIDRIVSQLKNHPLYREPKFASWLFRQTLLSIRTIDVLDRLLRKYPVGLVMDTAEIVNPAATLVPLARKYKLPFVLAPQFLIADRSFIPARATHFFAWGDYYRDWMRARGIPANKIQIAGNVRMEQMMQQPYSSCKRWQRKVGSHDRRRVIVVATQPFADPVLAQVKRWLLRIVAESLPYIILVKPHPSDRSDYSALAMFRQVQVLPSDFAMHELVAHGDILATISSNTALEAALFHKPVFVLQPRMPYDYEIHNNSFNAHLAKAQAGPVITNAEQWIRLLKRFHYDGLFRKLLVRQSRHFLARSMQTTESASKVTASLLKNIMNEQKRKNAGN